MSTTASGTNDSQSTAKCISVIDNAEVTAASISTDASRIVTGSQDGSVRLWDVAALSSQQAPSALVWATAEGHTGRVRSANFSPHGAFALTAASGDRTFRLWNCTTGECLHVIHDPMRTGRLSASFAPNGRQFLTCSGDGVRLWDLKTKACLWVGHHGELLFNAVFSPDSRQIVACSNKKAVVTDTATGDCCWCFSHNGFLVSAAFSPDGLTMVTAGMLGIVSIWSLLTRNCVRVLTGHTGIIHDASFSADGSLIVTAGFDHSARIWKASTGECLVALGHQNRVSCASFSCDGKHIVTASGDVTARFWRLSL